MRFFYLTLLLAFALLVHAAEKPVTIGGSTTIQPIMEQLSSSFMADTNQTLEVIGGGSEQGIGWMRDGRIDIAMVSRTVSPEEKQHFRHLLLGFDGVAIIVQASNRVESLSKQEIIALYDGTLRDWQRYGSDEQLIVISKHANRGTLHVFEAYTGLRSPNHTPPPKAGTPLIRNDAWEAESNTNMLLWVAGLRGAIGFVSIGEAQRFITAGVPLKMVAVEGITPTQAHLKDGSYPILRTLNLLYDPNNPKALLFLKWLQEHDLELQKVLGALGFVGERP